MLDGVGAASEPNILQAVPTLSGYLGRLALAENDSEHSDIKGGPPIDAHWVRLTRLRTKLVRADPRRD
jgi:hypothetical protein